MQRKWGFDENLAAAGLGCAFICSGDAIISYACEYDVDAVEYVAWFFLSWFVCGLLYWFVRRPT